MDEVIHVNDTIEKNGVLRAFQTNRVATLLKQADEAYLNIMHLIDGIEQASTIDRPLRASRPGDIHFIDDKPSVVNERTDLAEPPLAALQLNTPIDRGVSKPLDDARVICLYEGDTMQVIDCGAILFSWPKGE